MRNYYMYNNYFQSVQRLEEIISHHISCWVPGVFDIYSLQSHYIIIDAPRFKIKLSTKDFHIRTKYLTWRYFVENQNLSNIGKFFRLYLCALSDLRILILQIQYDFIYNGDV